MINIKDKFVYVTVDEDTFDLDIEELLCSLVEANPRVSFVSPSLNFSCLVGTLSLPEMIEHHLTLLDLCDEMWVFGHAGNPYYEFEREYAERYHIPIIIKR